MLMKAYDIAPDMEAENNFADAGSTYHTGYLAAAKRLGIANGMGNNRFEPERELTRQEMYTFLHNILEVLGKLPKASSGKSLSLFEDAKELAPWAKEAVTYFVETGIIDDNGGKLRPKDTAGRIEMVQALYNY